MTGLACGYLKVEDVSPGKVTYWAVRFWRNVLVGLNFLCPLGRFLLERILVMMFQKRFMSISASGQHFLFGIILFVRTRPCDKPRFENISM